MKLKPIVLSLALSLSSAAQAGAINVSGSFDYAYQMYGSSRTLPIQVFDDGKYTYLEVSGSNHGKLTVQHSGNQEITVIPGNQDGEGFIRLPGIFSSFHVRGHGLNAEIAYMGVDKRSLPKLVKLSPEPSPSTVSILPVIPAMAVAPAVAVAMETHETARVTPALFVTPVAPESSAVGTKQVILEKPINVAIPFWNGKTSLGPKGRSAVARVASMAKSGGHVRLVIGGDGGAEGNVMAEKRAKSVSAKLASLGVASTQVEVVTQTSGVRAGRNVFVSSAEVSVVSLASSSSGLDSKKNYNDPRVASVMSLWRAKVIDDAQAKVLLHTIGKRDVEPVVGTATSLRISYTVSDAASSTSLNNAKSQEKPYLTEPTKILAGDKRGVEVEQPKPLVEQKAPAPVKDGSKPTVLHQAEAQVTKPTLPSDKPLAAPEPAVSVAVVAKPASVTSSKPAEEAHQEEHPTLVVKAGEPLAYLLRDYLASNGMRLVWGVADAWKMAATSSTFSGATPLEAVGSLLRASGLQGFYARAENTLFIR